MTADFIAETSWIAESWPADMLAETAILSSGIGCTWSADPTVGTDNIMAFGWAPTTDSDWQAWTDELLATEEGWFVEEGNRGQYLTSKPDYWVLDEEGYGTTYLFTGDHVILALTKAETDDVTGPPVEPRA